jgi:hypothetical protein
VPRDLTPEQRQTLEEFIRAPITDPSAPPSLRAWFDEPRRAAELILRLSGPDGTDEDQRELAELMAAQRLAPWHWVKRDAEQRSKWTDDRIPVTADERRHKRQKTVAENAVCGWIGSAAVARDVEAARSELVAIVDPLVLPDQLTVTLVTAHFLGGTGYYPDGSEWPNPFDGAPQDVRDLAEQIQPVFVAALFGLARRLEAAGVRLDPNDPAVLLVLSQLALLEVDFTRPAAEIVLGLNIWPPGFVDREAASHGQIGTWSSRHGRNARFQADLAASAEAVAHRVGPPPIRPPYAGGHQRATRRDTLRLQRALASLVVQDPSLTPSSLLGLVRGDDHPALKKLRKALGVGDGWMPDQRRIERLWPKSRH